MRTYKPEGTTYKFKGFKPEALESIQRTGAIIEAPVIRCDSDLNMYVSLGQGITGIIPYSEFEYNTGDKSAAPKNSAIMSKVAKSVCFKVTSIEKDDETEQLNVLLSRKSAQQECYENYIKSLKLGEVINARITHVENYGAFCDIGCGIIGLLPINYFCIAKVREPKVALRQIRNIKAIVHNIDESGRVILSQKELLGTWEEEVSKFNIGDVIIGTVKTIEDYGIFVELSPNLVGLAEYTDSVAPGDTVGVLVKSVVVPKMKVKLLIVNTDNVVKPFMRLNYHLPKDGFVKHWVYSPESSDKVIESIIGKDDIEKDVQETEDEEIEEDNKYDE